ncbi:hypothetical protein FACS1894188_03690 [Clostridia bacterium]|nr:hypothetical protein FACS1894188_03690 [Clostridia bacterium]
MPRRTKARKHKEDWFFVRARNGGEWACHPEMVFVYPLIIGEEDELFISVIEREFFIGSRTPNGNARAILGYSVDKSYYSLRKQESDPDSPYEQLDLF